MQVGLMVERLKCYEAILREKGVDPNQLGSNPEAEPHHMNSGSGVSGDDVQLPTPESTSSVTQTTVFRPQLVHAQRGTKLVDK